MTYVISDIHGCYREYRELLEKSLLVTMTSCLCWETLWIGGRSLLR